MTSDPEPRVHARREGMLCYTDEGPAGGPALICVPGVPGTVRDFRYLTPALTDRVRVIRIDLPGYGGSAPVDDALCSFAGRARAIVDLADHLGLAGFAVLGHSMGGATALATASLHRERVGLLVLAASVGLRLHRGLGHPPWVFRGLSLALRVPGLGSWVVEQTRAAYRKRGFPGMDALDTAAVSRDLRVLAATDFALLRRFVAGPLPRTLIAYAEDDRLVDPPISRELAAALSGARVLAFPEGGHNIQKTRVAELAAAIAEELCSRA